MEYVWLRNIHITTVTVTSVLFVLRWYWALIDSPQLKRRWAKTLPHVNDTVLLVTGLLMAHTLRQYPFTADWLTAKFAALLCYIVLGSIAIKRGRNRRQKSIAGVLALACLSYLVSVALTRTPFPWLVWG